MDIVRTSFIILLFLTSVSCQPKTKSEQKEVAQKAEHTTEVQTKLSEAQLQKFETAYFASGCFWCVEAIFESVKGVKEVYSGYSGGTEKDPTYEQVSYGRTTHAEAVKVYYDPEVISFTQLVQVFFGSHDPTTLNQQGPDRGAQYRSIAFYKNEKEKKIIQDYINELETKNVYGNRSIVTEVKAFDKFYMAEEYHQDYERRNPNNSYIRNVSIPRLNRFKQNFGSYLKENAH
ncbi:MAG: peptide-methionine (S)-S-oxide reductase MsrA [Algicola sp.]|nr:peptide-methionine (S)-S-oxide reductase MsrA [Algicola sp.]